MRICFKLTTMIFLIIFLTADQGNSAVKKRDLDLIVVLDDSGSMKKNDPEGLTKDAAKIIVDKVDMNDRMALVSFGTKSTLLSGLIQISNENIKKWFKSMIENLPQKDMYTNITSAIERSLYELKHNGRKDALQSIILLTDGKLDIPGGEAKRTESMNFLKTSIINDYKDLGILIYSIAFTEESDFSLMQFLAQSTGGEYYRAYTTSDLKDSFDAIYNDLVKKQTIELEETMPEPKVEKQEKLPPLITPELPEKKGISVITIIFFVGTLVLIVSAFLLVIRTKRKPLSEDEILKSSLPESKEPVSPQPERLEEEKDTYKTMIRFTSAQENFYLEPDVKIEGVNNIFLKKRITRVGRKGDNDIVLPHSFISGHHAEIYWEENHFILRDLNSTNGTYLNGKKIDTSPLKEGDEISFDRIKFHIRSLKKADNGDVQEKDIIGRKRDNEVKDDGNSDLTMDKPSPDTGEKIY